MQQTLGTSRFVRGAPSFGFAGQVKAAGLLGSESNPSDAIIIGAGLAGLTTALSIVDRGGTVVLVEKEGDLLVACLSVCV